MNIPNIAFLLDSAPRTWSSQEDRHLAICRAISARGAHAVLVFASELPTSIQQRFQDGGVSTATINYSEGPAHYYKELRKVIEKNSIECVHIIFFDYFRAIGWLSKLSGVKSIIYEMQNGGVFKAKSWKRKLIHARNRIMTAPYVRIIAISDFIKGQLVEGGVPKEKIVVRHLGIDTDRFKPQPLQRNELVRRYSIRPDCSLSRSVRPVRLPF